MTIHYHGTPISPVHDLYSLAGRHFCVSFARPDQVVACHKIGQSVMLDNGAFTFWRHKRQIDLTAYYRWCEKWLQYQTTWAVIPDVIDGPMHKNDRLIREWPFGDRGAPVWHLHESLQRLEDLCSSFKRVCLGSSKSYSTVGSSLWHARMEDAMNVACDNGVPKTWLHMMRGMKLSKSKYPFASVDSTDIARNHHLPNNLACLMAEAWDRQNCPPTWAPGTKVS